MSPPNCYVTVIQDGVLLGSRVDVGRVNGSDLAAAEYYAGGAEAPPQYNSTQQRCGTLVLSTRER